MRILVHPAIPAAAPRPPRPVALDAVPGARLSEAIWLSGRFSPLPLCGGLGRCGRCRVRFLGDVPEPLPEEVEILGDAVHDGWRLACRRQIPDGEGTWEVRLFESVELPCAAPVSPDPGKARPGTGDLLLAVDLGTTSMAWRAMDMGGAIVAEGEELNPQAGAGGDVMSRLALCAAGEGKRLAGLVRRRLAAITASLPGSVARLVLAGNTAMTDIFLGLDIGGLCAAPYRVSHPGAETFPVEGLPDVTIPPLPGPFLGGDLSAGLVCLLARGEKPPFVLADMGTNGEFILMDGKGRLFFTSVPLGPALEGIGPECGRQAGPGTVTACSLSPFGVAMRLADGRDAKMAGAAGMSATGYLSLLAALVRAGALTPEGQFVDPQRAQPLARRLLAGLDRSRRVPRLVLAPGLWLSLDDVEEILKVKAAFSVALDLLLEAAGLAAGELPAILLAGALGHYVAPSDLETLGFVPRGMAGRVRAVGNTSLEGAALLALHPEKLGELAATCAGAVLLQPADDPSFHSRYIGAMRLGD